MAQVAAEVSTRNQNLELDITAEFEATVSDSIDEALDWYGSEEMLLKAIQSDQVRRQKNAARPVLRDAEQEMDWNVVAQRLASSYKPGRKGGFSAPEVEASALEQAGSVEEMIELLRARGVNVTG